MPKRTIRKLQYFSPFAHTNGRFACHTEVNAENMCRLSSFLRFVTRAYRFSDQSLQSPHFFGIGRLQNEIFVKTNFLFYFCSVNSRNKFFGRFSIQFHSRPSLKKHEIPFYKFIFFFFSSFPPVTFQCKNCFRHTNAKFKISI